MNKPPIASVGFVQSNVVDWLVRIQFANLSIMKLKLAFSLLLLCLFSTFALNADAQTKRRRKPRTLPATSKPSAAAITTPSGLTYLVTRKGTGRQPKAGDTVVLHYTGTLTDGVKFDSSRDRNQPFAFKLGMGQVIKGYDEGLSKLHVGEQAILIIPGDLAYGPRGIPGAIPPNATLIFIVELLDVKSKALSDMLSKVLAEKGVEAMIAEFHRIKTEGEPDLYQAESDLNLMGYNFLRKNQVNEAIEVLKLNVEAYPQSANVYDSLAEAYLVSGNRDNAIENYKKALAIDPNMDNARRALKRLGVQ
jgi:peptidylprolyl isomerase